MARWRTVAKWSDIARKHRFDREEFFYLVKALDRKEKSKVFSYFTDSKQIEAAVKVEEDKEHKAQGVQPEAYDQYLEEVKRRPRRGILRQRKIQEDEEKEVNVSFL